LFGFSSYFAGLFNRLNIQKMTHQDLNFAIANTIARLYQLPEGTEIEFKAPLTLDFEVNGHYHEVADITKLHRYGLRIDLEGTIQAAAEDNKQYDPSVFFGQPDLYSPSHLFNPSDILQIFDACKEARPDLFTDQTSAQ